MKQKNEQLCCTVFGSLFIYLVHFYWGSTVKEST